MSPWTDEQLDLIGDAEQLLVASERSDGSLRPFTTVWVARVGDDLYVRSAYGPRNGWYRRAKTSGAGRIKSAGVIRDVRFVHMPEGDDDLHTALDAEFRRKYADHSPAIVATVLGDDVRATTLRLDATD
ncbi:hypothetical protein GCM10009819_14580 [Agromyces tropicus]|uniref:DUF2255 family protein n=1 Tax=Agromyces tropicus TaxID=555371 RepID=A0ABN2U9H7_9MICO